MSAAADLIRRMIEAGTPADIIADVAAELARGEAARELIEGRRAKDRERKAKDAFHGIPRNSAESAEQPPLEARSPTPPKTQTPSNITPLISPQPDAALRQDKRRGTRLPDNWQPSADEINEAIKIGLSFDQATAEAEKFRDYWTAKAGRDAVKLDWLATWRNWCRNAKARGSPRGAASRPGYDPRFDTRSGQYDPVLHAKVRSW